MKRTLDAAMKAIADMEETVKKLKPSSKKTFSFFFLIICMSIFSLQLSAQTKADVDKLYQKGNYMQAVKGYEKLLKQGESAALYYNLGNSYYRLITSHMPCYHMSVHSVLLQAMRIFVSTLQLAQSKTIDN